MSSPPLPSPRPPIELFGIAIDNLTMDEVMDAFEAAIARRARTYAVTPNVDHVVKLSRDPEFAAIYARATWRLVDGMPIVWFARLLGEPFVAKVSGSDILPAFCARAAAKGHRMYFLGAAPGVAEKAAANLTARFGELHVAGCCSPLVGFERDPAENARLVAAINDARPDILFVALGAPKQERWIAGHRDALDVPVAIGIGASLDFEAGIVRRAPRWMQRGGLEWFFRLVQQPRHLFKRYLIDDMRFLALMWRERRRRRALRRRPAPPSDEGSNAR